MRTEEKIVLLVDDNVELCYRASGVFFEKGFAVRIASNFDSFVTLTTHYKDRLMAVLVDPWSVTFRDGLSVLSFLSLNFKQTALPIGWTIERDADKFREKRNWARSRGAYELFDKNDLEEIAAYLLTTPIWELLIGVSEYDGLTKLFNRRGFMGAAKRQMRLMQRVKSSETNCLMMADLNKLKTINDNLGHAAGDSALERAAIALQDKVRHTDVLGRYGGDEFVALLTGIRELEFYAKLRPKIDERVAELTPENVRNAGITLSLSCGVSQFDYETLNSLGVDETLTKGVEKADAEMYSSKKGK